MVTEFLSAFFFFFAMVPPEDRSSPGVRGGLTQTLCALGCICAFSQAFPDDFQSGYERLAQTPRRLAGGLSHGTQRGRTSTQVFLQLQDTTGSSL